MSSSPPPVEAHGPGVSTDDVAAPAAHVPDNRSTSRAASPTPAKQSTESADSARDTHRCFICLGDELEASMPDDWSTPCSCSLEGHQSCLLTWVTDLESQGKEYKCPVCKSKIHVVDRWDPAVRLSDQLLRYCSGLSPIILCGFLGGGVFIANATYGIHAVEVFAGPGAANGYILNQPDKNSVWDDLGRGLRTALLPLLGGIEGAQHRPRNMPTLDAFHFFTVSLIAPALILNRLHFGEIVFIPTSLLYAIFFGDYDTDALTWPPLPHKALVAFPTIRALYFRLYRLISGHLDKRVATLSAAHRNLPGETTEAEQLAPRQDVEPEPDDENIVDIQIDLQLGAQVERENAPQNPPANDPAPARRDPTNAVSSLTNYLAGALLWPTVSFGMGSLLQMMLPKSWVTRSSGPATGLLQERWGRSLVGGCLFVVIKDAFYLYVRYRRGINRPHRRIKNADRRNRPA
ncbi:uncharacterized protein BCR38DRAFT_347117 [Pseudomassariella vexata]|uniref:Uncharacterized protein n=1 Tax=Pseudomassariella vexata TaxID=1141098 RepID=A0A1Y2DSV7_9PEZI|nr:uncharacterized protein BCR38DRAFT_347117 [Pseudomassariella vexata]ORY62352.1 hypothetical protein BCR38DRAFT_347117 [Pseudomassariella vexata]